jgi:hypothetical protein
MKRIILALLVGSALITSCGSNKSFTKKRHSHRNWVKVGEYTDSEFAKTEALETEKEATTVAVVDAPITENSRSNPVLDNNGPKSEQTSSTTVRAEKQITTKAPKDKTTTISQKNVEETAADRSVQEEKALPEPTTVANMPKAKWGAGIKQIKEKSVGELLVLALIILLIIVVFSFLDGILKGLLSTLLFIFLVLLLLRYFGVI